jgi:hypothetical protein
VLAEYGLAERVSAGQHVQAPIGWRLSDRADLDRLAAHLGTTQVVVELIDEYRAEREAWRALLDARVARRNARVLRSDEVIAWPEHLVAPDHLDPADAAYDAALATYDDRARQAEVRAAADLVQRELGATILARISG